MESAKVEQLRKHIDECKNILAKDNPKEAAEIIETIGRAYYYENDDFVIRPAYDKFGNTIYESNENLKNLKCLIVQMEVRLGQWADEYNIQQKQNDNNAINSININNQNNNTASATINQNINLKTTLKSINEISNEILDEKEKRCLSEILDSINSLKEMDKGKTKNKVVEVLKYIADKGIEVGIAVLPYLGEIVKLLR